MPTDNIIPFVYEENGDHAAPVRVVIRDGEPWFVAADLARVLGYRDAEKVVRHLDEDEKGTLKQGTPGGDQQHLIVSESGMYALIFRSRKPTARQFRKWVTAEVLPTIRKTGRYDRRIERQPGQVPPGLADDTALVDKSKVVAFLHQHQLRVFAAARGVGMGSTAPIDQIAGAAGLSFEATCRHLALLYLLGLVGWSHADRLDDLLDLAPPQSVH